MTVREILTQQVQYADGTTSVKEVAELMKKNDCGSIFIGKDDKLVGVLTDRDITLRVVAEGKDPSQTQAKDVMTENVLYCFDTDSVSDTINNMAENAVRRLVVLDGDKNLVGVVSFAQLTAASTDKDGAQNATNRILKAS